MKKLIKNNSKSPYNSRDWIKLSKEFRRFNPLCENCIEKGKIKSASEVHHKGKFKNRKEMFDVLRLQSLCKSCHAIITGKERQNEILRRKTTVREFKIG